MGIVSKNTARHRLQMLVSGEPVPEDPDAPPRRCPTCSRELLPGEERCIRDGSLGVAPGGRKAATSPTAFMLPMAAAQPSSVQPAPPPPSDQPSEADRG